MATLRSGTAHLSDEEFLRALESCELAGDLFHHADHVRMTWLYVRRFGEAEARVRAAQSIQRFAAHHGSAPKYHHTMTLAWVRLIAAASRSTPEGARFEDFSARHPHLFDPAALAQYYSPELLASPAARADWIEPDLRPLP
jgi:hypothetical protein